jgi:hypothetical protein
MSAPTPPVKPAVGVVAAAAVMARRPNLDPDAARYILAVEAADAAVLETGVKTAINAFVVGCKRDGIWGAIKTSCILAGARTLSGALVPLVGGAPTNNNFVSGDYDRKTGLKGNGTTKYLNTERLISADPQNNNHLSYYVTTASSTGVYGGVRSNDPSGVGDSLIEAVIPTSYPFRNRVSGFSVAGRGTRSLVGIVGFIATSRSSSADFITRDSGVQQTLAVTSAAVSALNVFVFTGNNVGVPSGYSNSRLAFYSIGESIDLAKLDARVTALVNAYGAAI